MDDTTGPAVDEVTPEDGELPVVQPTEPAEPKPAAEPEKVQPMHGGWGTQDQPLAVN